jgi:hypothetical protein
MKRDCDTLDDLLIAWHQWAKGYQYVSDIHGSPMFNQAKSPRGWDAVQDIVDHEIDAPRMVAVNFHIFELPSIQCTAIQINARNLATGQAVWNSARLPADVEERQIILRAARNALRDKLMGACIL